MPFFSLCVLGDIFSGVGFHGTREVPVCYRRSGLPCPSRLICLPGARWWYMGYQLSPGRPASPLPLFHHLDLLFSLWEAAQKKGKAPGAVAHQVGGATVLPHSYGLTLGPHLASLSLRFLLCQVAIKQCSLWDLGIWEHRTKSHSADCHPQHRGYGDRQGCWSGICRTVCILVISTSTRVLLSGSQGRAQKTARRNSDVGLLFLLLLLLLLLSPWIPSFFPSCKWLSIQWLETKAANKTGPRPATVQKNYI